MMVYIGTGGRHRSDYTGGTSGLHYGVDPTYSGTVQLHDDNCYNGAESATKDPGLHAMPHIGFRRYVAQHHGLRWLNQLVDTQGP